MAGVTEDGGIVNHEGHEDEFGSERVSVALWLLSPMRGYCPRSFSWNSDWNSKPSTWMSLGSSTRTPTIPPIFSSTVKEFDAMADRVGVASTTAPLTT